MISNTTDSLGFYENNILISIVNYYRIFILSPPTGVKRLEEHGDHDSVRNSRATRKEFETKSPIIPSK